MEKFQKIVATGFLIKDNKVLIVKRSANEKFLPEYWEMAGGKVEFGEDPQVGLVREYHEEVGLTITVGKPFRTFSYISSDGNRHTVEITYLCHSDTDEEIQLSSAHTEYAWITKMEVDAYKISNEMKTSIREGFGQV
jgi:8-oxo-dGTP diphosphatase